MKTRPIALFGIFLLIAAASGAADRSDSAIADPAAVAAPSTCQFRHSNDRWTGSCGAVFDEAPVFTIAPTNSITTGIWRQGVRPKTVWAGVLTNTGDPDYAVEIEVYANGTGVLRSEYGWFSISAFSSDNSTVRFQLDTSREVAPGPLDRAILKRSDVILTSPAVWNRMDDRKCAPTASTWSIYCAIERATTEVTGGFHHRRPAMELVRQIVEERTQDRGYHHRLMDYNNDPTTTLADIHSLFAEALRRIPD
ncbi:MAG: hypothetical protein ABSG12_14520 [Steroidobacteraceae bacterium]